MTCIPFKILFLKDTNRLTFPLTWAGNLSRLQQRKTENYQYKCWGVNQMPCLVLSECCVTLPLTSWTNLYISAMYCGERLLRDLYTIRDFLYWTLSVRGIHPNFFKSGLVGVLVGRSYIILAALFCSLKSLPNWALPQIQLQ